MVRKVLLRGGALATAVVGAIAVIGRDTPPGRALRHVGEVAGRRTRDLRNRFEGVRYRLSGRSPDPTVTDDVLADRVRSSLGPLVKRLDVPHPHVMVERHVVLLHGEVSARADADALEAAVARVPGVLGVESFLHVGLVPGDTRPSQGRAEHRASPALRRLVRAAEEAGASRVGAVPAVRAVLGAFADRLPAGELDHLLAHLPEDVRALAGPPRRTGEIPST
ncbi:MAG: BON domain-containing protein [Acidimicrobiia bacterium]|nr:BON domain-containing protein [Acidimicrobiia bacterium]